MLVWVLEGEPGTYLGERSLNYHATREKKGSGRREEIGEGALRLGTADEEGQLFVPLMLHDTGCDLIRVGVMIGQVPPANQTILPFRCEG